jgi:cytochrome c-type biogenesis protein
MNEVSIPLAFAAGLASFLSPCVLPLVPGYISYMSGVSAAEQETRSGLKAGAVALAFVGGFTAVFIPLGLTATLLGHYLNENQELLSRIGGAVIIVLGLIFVGIIRVPWLYREMRFHPRPGAGVAGSALLGATFAFGWSPCIGTTLGIVLTMAAGSGAASGGVAEGALLLLVYSLGLGLPFLLAGLGVSRLTGAVAWLRRHTRVINLVSGALLIFVGLLFVSGQFFQMSIWFQRTFPEVPFSL